jgi:hypothetical protein
MPCHSGVSFLTVAIMNSVTTLKVQFFDGSSKLLVNTQCIRISQAEHQASVRCLELAGADPE